MKPDLSGFGDWSPVQPMRADGVAWLAQSNGRRAVARPCTHMDEAAMRWLAKVPAALNRAGLQMPAMIRTDSGAYRAGGWSLSTWIDAPPCPANRLHRLELPLGRFHAFAEDMPQRPGQTDSQTQLKAAAPDGMPDHMAALVRQAFAPLSARRTTVIHGALSSARVLMPTDGPPVLLGWDAARRDLPLFDRIALHPKAPATDANAALAWEIWTNWPCNPLRAQTLAQSLSARMSTAAP